MKSFLITIFLFSTFIVCQAQQAKVIEVEDLKPPAQLLQVDSYQHILEGLIRVDSSGEDALPSQQKAPVYGIVAKSQMSEKLVDMGYHPFFEGMYHAYASHRPYTLSPDIVWLLICQGFSQHVNNNAETLRHLFVDFEGKLSLVVTSNQITLDDPNSPWEDVFPEFSKKISENTSKELTETLTADFTTTTPITKIASQITLMDAMKPYFNFMVIYFGCGIPKVTIEGTPEDWQKVLDKTEALRRYKLDWWVDKMEPVLNKILAASKGEVDKAFWQDMFKYHSAGKCGSPAIVDGWVAKFFPYDKFGKRNGLDSVSMYRTLPNEMVKVDLDYEKLMPSGEVEKTPLELWAGFVGLEQDDETFGLKPQIGWMIRKKGAGASAKYLAELKKENSESDVGPNGLSNSVMGGMGIMITVKTIPDELLQIGHIRKLTVYFVDGIQIPDEMSKIKIDSFEMHGKIDQVGIDKICKMFPNTYLIINNYQYANGKPVEIIR